jgi:hypothetical protein
VFPRNKLLAVAVGPIVALALYLYLGVADFSSAEAQGDGVGLIRQWLAILSALYTINYIIAWKYRSSWPMTMGRILVWGAVAYLCISHTVDLFGEHREVVWQIAGSDGPGSKELITLLRARLAGWVVCLAMSLVCIAVGFEKDASDEKKNPS